MGWRFFWFLVLVGPVSGAVVVTGSSVEAGGLDGVVQGFRGLVSGGGYNNGVGGGPYLVGRREVAWDAASLDPYQVPAEFPGGFFNSVSLRGLVLTTEEGSSLRVSGREASGSADVVFSTLNAGAAAGFQVFSPERLLAVFGSTVVEASFRIPTAPMQSAVVQGFGAVFADVSIFGPTRLEAWGRSGQLLAAVEVPAAPGGLSFAGIWIDGGEWIERVRLTVGQAGIDHVGLLDVVALDDFIYAEPQVIPEPGVIWLVAVAGLVGARFRWRWVGPSG